MEVAIAEADRLRTELQAAADDLRLTRENLEAARLAEEQARATADDRLVLTAKSEARQRYRLALAEAETASARQAAAAAWMREIDRINRASRDAIAVFVACQARSIAHQQLADAAQRNHAACRIKWEAAAAACVDARSDVAEALERSAFTVPIFDEPSPAASPTHVIAIDPGTPAGSSASVLDRLVDGDRGSLDLVAQQMAELTGGVRSQYLLLIQELIDELAVAAADAGLLVFDHNHPFWAQFTPAEARTIALVLRDVGFRFHPRDGWYGRRVPAVHELALALAYAGWDLRRLRGFPAGDDLRQLPESVTVSTREHVAALAPDLDLDQMLQLLGSRADRLGDLWDVWTHLRALLLEESTVLAV
jgi:hypothetical protein